MDAGWPLTLVVVVSCIIFSPLSLRFYTNFLDRVVSFILAQRVVRVVYGPSADKVRRYHHPIRCSGAFYAPLLHMQRRVPIRPIIFRKSLRMRRMFTDL